VGKCISYGLIEDFMVCITLNVCHSEDFPLEDEMFEDVAENISASSAVQCSAVQCSAVQCSAVQCSVKYSEWRN
jgi:hypothetical protein